MAIEWQRPEYLKQKDRWQLVDDMVRQEHLKDYIPDLDVLKETNVITGRENLLRPQDNRNRAFKERASFLAATSIALDQMVGVAFERDPQITLPAGMEYLLSNVDGSGVDMWQQMQEAAGEALKKGRGGLYVTMPQTDGESSLADQEALRNVATVNLIEAKRITNWWTAQDGADTYLAGVVFTDTREIWDDYEIKSVEVCRELALDEAGNFYDRAWVKGEGSYEPEEPIYPRDSSGNLLRRIPFLFFGARRNHWQIQVPPLYNLARKNADHLINSAINEEGVWFSGHIQPTADEMDPEAFDTIHEKGIRLGGGHLIVAKGFKYAVAEPNTAARQAMEDKAHEMASLGARILQPGAVAKTAQQDAGEQRAQYSILSLVSVNIEDAYQWACERVQEFMGTPGEIAVKLNRSFMEPQVTAEKMREMRENMLSGVIGPAEMFRALQLSGDIDPDKTLEEYQEEIAQRGLVTNADAGPAD